MSGDNPVAATAVRALGGGQSGAQGNADAASSGQDALANQEAIAASQNLAWYNKNVRPGLTAEIQRTQAPDFVAGQRTLGASRSAADFAQSEAGLDAARNRSAARMGLNPADAFQATSSDQVRRIAARTGAVNTGANQMELTARAQQAAALGAGAPAQSAAAADFAGANSAYGAVANREQQVSDNQTNRSPVGRFLGGIGFGAAEGGPMESPGADQEDTIPATVDGVQPARLNHGEFVVDAPTKNWMGEKFFHKLKEKAAMERAAARQSTPGNTAPPTHQIIRPQRYDGGGAVAPQADRAAAISNFARNWYTNRGVADPGAPPAPTARYDGGGPVYLKQAQGGPAKGFARITKAQMPVRHYDYGGTVQPLEHKDPGENTLAGKMQSAVATKLAAVAFGAARGGPIAKPLPMPTGAAQTDAMMAGMPQGKQMSGMVQPGLPGQAQLQQQMKKGQVRRIARMAAGGPVNRAKVGKTMHEFKHGALHSGSKTGPLVTKPKQAIAIALNQARRMAPGGPIVAAEPWPWGDNGQPYSEVEKKKSFGNKQGMAYGGPVRRYAAGDEVQPPDQGQIDPNAAARTQAAMQQDTSGSGFWDAAGHLAKKIIDIHSGDAPTPSQAEIDAAEQHLGNTNLPPATRRIAATSIAIAHAPNPNKPGTLPPGPAYDPSQAIGDTDAQPHPGAPPIAATTEAPPTAAEQAPAAIPGGPAAATPVSTTAPAAAPAVGAAQTAGAPPAATPDEKPAPFKIPLWAYFLGPKLFGMYVQGKQLEFNREQQQGAEQITQAELKNMALDFGIKATNAQQGGVAGVLQQAMSGNVTQAVQDMQDPSVADYYRKIGATSLSVGQDGTITFLGKDGQPVQVQGRNVEFKAQQAQDFIATYSGNLQKLEQGTYAALTTKHLPAIMQSMARGKLRINAYAGVYYHENDATPHPLSEIGMGGGRSWGMLRPNERLAETKMMNKLIQDDADKDIVMKQPTRENREWIANTQALALHIREKFQVDATRATVLAREFAKEARNLKIPAAQLQQHWDKQLQGLSRPTGPAQPQGPAAANKFAENSMGSRRGSAAVQPQRVQPGG